MAVLRRLAERVLDLVLDVHLRKPGQDRRVPTRRLSREVGLVRRRARGPRLRRRDSGALVTVLGLGVATAVLAGVLAGTTIATDRSTAQAIEEDPDRRRSVRAAWFGIPGDSSERLASSTGTSTTRWPGSGSPGRPVSSSSARARSRRITSASPPSMGSHRT
jgi:hypothetical protein